jgi:pimeloyl-ACP methyl ester carboxylesterase
MPQATNNGIRIHYEVEGQGPPLLLHTGFMGSIQRWYYTGYAEALRDDYRLIILDPRGQGDSDKPHDVESYALKNFVADAVAVLDDAGVPTAHFFGYSLGATVGFGAGVLTPDRFASLILGGGDPYLEVPQTLAFPTVQEDVEMLRKGMTAYIEALEERFGPLPAVMREQWLNNDGQALAASLQAIQTFPGIAERISTVTLPALIFCGTEDTDVYEPARRASEAMSNVRFVSFEGLDHLQVFSSSDLVLPHVRAFLTEVAASRSPSADE